MKLKLDCRHFRGEKPCKYGCGCAGCAHYEPMGTRILIIKLDAVGDVARTTTLLRPLREEYGPCHITWLVHPNGEGMLRGNSQIDRLLAYVPASLESLRVERFDLVLCLDKTPRACGVGTWVNGERKLGFGLSEYGTPYPLNAGSEYAFQLGLDDELKFRRNTRTYQDVIFECCEMTFRGEDYCIEIEEEDRAAVERMLRAGGIAKDDTVVGLNLGGGKAFAHKMWDADGAMRFLKALVEAAPCKVLLFGAELEREKIATIMAARIPGVVEAITSASCRVFQAMLARCDVVVTGDSLGMHLALAEKRPVAALFGPTCAQEIEMYGRGEKIVSPVACAPCYSATCTQTTNCMDAISAETVVEAVKRLLCGCA